MNLFLNSASVRQLAASAVAAISLTLVACDSAEITSNAPPPPPVNLIDTAIAAGNFTTLNAALEAAGLNTLLADDSAEASYTVFAPTDAAFAALGQPAIDALLADTDRLTDVLLYHVLPSTVNAEAATALAGTTITMQNGDPAALSLDGQQLRINTANITTADVIASNGIIHVIDAVLIPPNDATSADDLMTVIRADANFSTLVAAIEATGLEATLSDVSAEFTVFAPNNAAFTALGTDTVTSLLADPDTLRNILLYHVISGQRVDSITAISLAGSSVAAANGSDLAISVNQGNLLINTSAVTRADIPATNGVIHEINTVLTVPADSASNGDGNGNGDTAANLTAMLADEPDYSNLLSLLQSTGLDVTLADTATNYTIFAPDNAAFAALNATMLAGLTEDPTSLEAVLLSHVIPNSSITAADATALAGSTVTMADGTVRTITLTDGNLSIDGATITGTELTAGNGVIHRIDTLLLTEAEQ
ncbi:hypothetical protein AB833_22810 [Chromatiales bacterium (ex Bugula neritina AB1)]|nr:hypothetical protein AB833_22810 [Chromatiales bacterium (ex Bugula neritina AB1)]